MIRNRIRTAITGLAIAGVIAIGAGGTLSPQSAEARPWSNSAYCNSQLAFYNGMMFLAEEFYLKGDYKRMMELSNMADTYIENWYNAGCDR